MVNNFFEVVFENKSKIHDFSFWKELGVSDNMRVLRLAPRQSMVQKVFPDNCWANFERIEYKDTTAEGGEIQQVIKAVPRKGFKQELTNNGVFLKVNLNPDIHQGRNLPSLLQAYTLDVGEKKLNMLVGLKHKVEVPKNSFPAQFTEMTMRTEEHFTEDDYVPNIVFNSYKLSLVGKKSEKELRDLGILK